MSSEDEAPTPTAPADKPIADERPVPELEREPAEAPCASSQMTASYSEICGRGEGEVGLEIEATYPRRPKPLDLGGMVERDGDMTHFVADDLEYRIKLSSPVGRRDAPSSSLYRQLLAPQLGQVDITVLNDLEYEARRVAAAVDSLTEQLAGVLHSVSALTAAGVAQYGAAVTRTCDALDRNIRAMYTVLARGEEVSRAMAPATAHAARLANIRRLLLILESAL